MDRWISLNICLGFAEFLETSGLYLLSNLGMFQPWFLYIFFFFCTEFFPFLLWDSNDWMLVRLFDVVPQVPEALFGFLNNFFSLSVVQIVYFLLISHQVHWLLMSYPYSAIESIHWDFYFGYCIFFSSKIFIWPFVPPVSLLRLSLFPLVSRVYALTSWSTFQISCF